MYALLSRPSNPGGRENNIKISKIVFEYGPPELNLYKHVATKTHCLWEMATNKFILKVEGEPTDGFLVLHRDGENISEDFLNFFDFEQEGDSLPEGNFQKFLGYVEHFYNNKFNL